MKKILGYLFLLSTGLTVAFGGALTALAVSTVKPDNLLKNGNFSKWKASAAPAMGKIQLLSHKVPIGWPFIDNEAYGLAGNAKFTTQGAIGRSAHVHKAGKKPGSGYALLIQNGLRTDITNVGQMISVTPETVYKVSVWVKGANIHPSHRYGGGVYVWANWGPKHFWAHQHSLARQPKPNLGTFGWRKLTFRVDTGKGARHMAISLQLRCATGKAWFDHVSVVKIGKITPVKSF